MLLVQLTSVNVLFHVIAGWHYFFYKKFIVNTLGFFNRSAVAFFEVSVLKEVSILRYLNKNITNTKVTK